MDNLTQYEDEAREMGRQAGLNAASWIIDGNTSPDHIQRMVKMLDDGDPEFYDWINPPNLSGEWADDPSRDSLYQEITGHDPDSIDFEADDGWIMDKIADAWEAGVNDRGALTDFNPDEVD
jgi:hypothetical protein